MQAQFTTPQAARPIVNICQDELLAGYLMTREGRGDQGMDECAFHNLVGWDDGLGTEDVDAHLAHVRAVWEFAGRDPSLPPHTTYALLSLLLPTTLEYESQGVRIVQGVLLAGVLNKAVLGNRSGALVHLLYRNYGAETAVRFVTRYARLANRWLATVGFSVGVSDCLLRGVDPREGLDWCLRRAHHSADVGDDPTGPDGRLMEVLRERKVQVELNKATNIGQLASAHGLDPANRLRAIVSAGSKGSTINIAQITSALGQQNVSGGRPRPSRAHPAAAGRTLSYFSSWAVEADALGTLAADAPAGARTVWVGVQGGGNHGGGGALLWVGLPYPHHCTGLHRGEVVRRRAGGGVWEIRLATPARKNVRGGQPLALFWGPDGPADEMDSAGVWWVDPRPGLALDQNLRRCGARGFVAASYLEGLSPSEFVFHAAGGREGVIDTALKTAETGYMQRKMIKTTEDIVVAQTGLVMMGARVVSFATGDDGLDPKEGVRVGKSGQIQFADAAQLAHQLNGQVEFEAWRKTRTTAPIPAGIAPGETDAWPRIEPVSVNRALACLAAAVRRRDRDPLSLPNLAATVSALLQEPYEPDLGCPGQGRRPPSPGYQPETGASSPGYQPETGASSPVGVGVGGYPGAAYGSSPVYRADCPAYDPSEFPAYDPSSPAYQPSSPAPYDPEAPPYDPGNSARIAPDTLDRLCRAIDGELQ